jgi:hypothetical protein
MSQYIQGLKYEYNNKYVPHQEDVK